jgi:HK97 family phage prohead protease
METVYETVKIDSVEEVDGKSLIIKGYANRYALDGEVVIDDYGTSFMPTSFNISNYKKNPILLVDHDVTKPVGRVTLVEKRKDGLYIEAEVYKNSDRTTYHNICNKVISAFSVGAYIKEDYWSDLLEAWVIVSAELVEISVVALPSNNESFIEEVSLCSLGVCSVVRGKSKPTTISTSKLDKAMIEKMVHKILNKK